MENNIVKPNKIPEYKKFLGNKTLNLKKCLDQGFFVPQFIALSSKITKKLLKEEIFRKKVISETLSVLKCEKYTVRSSALIEDGKTESFAGQFLTKTSLSEKELENGICEVLEHAEKYLRGDLEKFSLIIQEYIIPDVFGVTFTRNPNGNREMIIEYGFCEGEKIVSGEIQPSKISFYWNQKPKKVPKFFTKDLIENFKKIETNNKFPQDIEWCIKNDQFYILQTRNITTISPEQYKEITFLEDFLFDEKQYFYEKTEISEIAPRPCPATYDLLSKIYDKDGPVSHVYKKYGIDYQDTNFLKIIGNELFVDKEKEIKSILPAYTYFADCNFKAKINGVKNLWKTCKNIFFLNTIKTNKYEALFEKIKKLIESKKQIESPHEAINHFQKEYETIFEINLLSGFSFKKLTFLLKKEPISVANILAYQDFFVSLKNLNISIPNNLKGNSLDISDETDFFQKDRTSQSNDKSIEMWWHSLSIYKKKILEEKIKESIFYNYLRELGRCLTVKNINILRNKLLKYANDQKFKDPKNIYFSPLTHFLNEEKAIENKEKYMSFGSYNFPNKITSSFVHKKKELIGVSSGKVAGEIQDIDFLKKKNTGNKKIILYTKSLSPQIAQYFDKISGIVSENGGMLSHLAIIAREQKIPVVVGFVMGRNNINPGDIIIIDGGNGKVEKQ